MATRTAGGRAIVNLLQLGDGEKVTGMVPVREFREDECLFMVTRRGTVKKTELTAFKPPAGPRDHRPGARRERPAHRRGPDQGRRPRDPQHPRRHGDPVRRVRRSAPMGRPAYGVKGIDLAGGRRGRRHDRGQRRRGPGQPPDGLRQRLRQADPADRVPLPEPRRQGADRHPDQRSQRARSSPWPRSPTPTRSCSPPAARHGHPHPGGRHPRRSAATPRASG